MVVVVQWSPRLPLSHFARRGRGCVSFARLEAGGEVTVGRKGSEATARRGGAQLFTRRAGWAWTGREGTKGFGLGGAVCLLQARGGRNKYSCWGIGGGADPLLPPAEEGVMSVAFS